MQAATESEAVDISLFCAGADGSCLAVGILRMIKLFGWEPKIAERLAGKRELELEYVKLRQILNLVNGNIKWVLPAFLLIFLT